MQSSLTCDTSAFVTDDYTTKAAASAYLTTVSARVQSYTKSLRGPLGPKLRDSAFHKSPTQITGMTLGAAQLCSLNDTTTTISAASSRLQTCPLSQAESVPHI